MLSGLFFRFPVLIPFLTSLSTTKQSVRKKKKSFAHYPCFDSFNAELFHLSLAACYSGNIMDLGAGQTEPSSSTYWADEIPPTSRFACVTEGEECFMGL